MLCSCLPALQMVSGEQVGQALAFAGDERLPGGERLSFRLALISLLKEQGQRLAQVGAHAWAFRSQPLVLPLLCVGSGAPIAHSVAA